MTILKMKCAWCQKNMGEKDGEGVEGTSHGICDDCLLYHFPHQYEEIKGITETQEVKGVVR